MKTSRLLSASLTLLIGTAAMTGCGGQTAPTTSADAPTGTPTAQAAEDIKTLDFDGGAVLPAGATVQWKLAFDIMQGWELIDDHVKDLKEGDHVVYNAESSCIANFKHLEVAGGTGLTDLQASDDALQLEIERSGAVRMDPADVVTASLGLQVANNPGLAARRYIAHSEDEGVTAVFFARAIVGIERGVLFFAVCNTEDLAVAAADDLLRKNVVVLR